MIFELLQLVVTFILSIVSISDGLLLGNCSGTSSCLAGGIQIQDPFWIPSDTAYTGCTYPGFAIKCEGARPVMNISNRLYYVQDIDESIITLMDPDMDGEKCPRPRHNFSLQSQPFLHSYIQYQNLSIFYNCTIPPGNGWYQLSCLENSYNNKTRRSYAFSSYPNEIPQEFQHWYNYCEESVVVPKYFGRDTNVSKSIEKSIESIRLYYDDPVDCDDCVRSGGRCSANQTATGGAFSCQCPRIGTRENRICYRDEALWTVRVITIYVSIGVGVLLLIVLLIYIRSISHWLYNLILSWKNKIGRSANVEAFLENYGCLSLQRYKYIDVKKMTNSFKETLGQGGYGIVYKGKLHDDCLVAVKVLNESKGNGEDFINEVTAIGGTNHVNVVRLLGFCIEGNKRALVYEFMSNGSLERFIYNNQQSSTTSTPLGWEKLYDIALGVARGLEYLHRGCNTRILHLDIKPHNILLDQNFCPKISDFGLAKLCPTLASVVSMVGARGTMGYIAPEVCCRNFGGVSHKSDVYSYGMMVLEMIGGRKNIDATVVNISQIYFPHWIYNHLEQGNKVHESEECDVEGSGESFENENAKKMIIVALWCIQPHPIDRPSMRKVAEMLEGNIEELQMPPNPNMGPQSKYSPSP